MTKKKCVVCSARVTNPSWETCDRICTRAKQNSRTRMRQLIAEMRQEAFVSRFDELEVRSQERRNSESEEDKHYNQPYLYGT